jgi:hypothetical protein
LCSSSSSSGGCCIRGAGGGGGGGLVVVVVVLVVLFYVLGKKLFLVAFKILMSVTMKGAVFCDTTPCSSVVWWFRKNVLYPSSRLKSKPIKQ